jgi:diguanylate cyclase (GGDEF)-like protein/PAS domain S-box-containing protein
MLLQESNIADAVSSAEENPEAACPDSYAEIMSAVGTDFFHLLNRHLAKTLAADSVHIAEIPLHAAGYLQTLAAFRDGSRIPDYSFCAAGMPCEAALAEGLVVCRGNLQTRFPGAATLAPGLRSFLAVGLQGCAGEPVGVLALGWYRKDPDLAAARRSLQAIVNRVSAEVQRTRVTAILQEQLHFTQELLDAIPLPVFYKDRQFRYLGCNREFEKALGRSRTEIIGRTVKDVAPKDFFRRYAEVDRQILEHGRTRTYEGGMRYDDGRVREVVFTKAALRDSERRISGVIGTMVDISALKSAEKAIYRMENYDALTGMHNRKSFLDHLNKALRADPAGRKRSIAVLCLDLDQFKSLGNAIGAESCNRLLLAYSERLTSYSRERDIYARINGDRFAVALCSLSREQDAELFARRMLAALAEPVRINGEEIFCTGSIGIAFHPQDGSDANRLLGNAEAAMLRARAHGGNVCRHFSREINKDALERLAIEAGLRRALAAEDFELYYQPQVDLKSRALLGAEALIRWTHPTLGAVSPQRFIPIAEESGLIIPLGEWVLRTACRQNAAWQAAGHAPIRVAVNLSGQQLHQRGFVRMVATVLGETGLAPEWLEFELTESTMMEHTEKNIEILLQLKKLGINLSIDDFGTGYSSLSYLQRFPLDKLKIDRSFVKDLHKTDSNAAITEAIIAMAHRLGLTVIAEGIETVEQLDYLVAHDCCKGQGYFFGRPAPGRDFEQHFQSAEKSLLRHISR